MTKDERAELYAIVLAMPNGEAKDKLLALYDKSAAKARRDSCAVPFYLSMV